MPPRVPSGHMALIRRPGYHRGARRPHAALCPRWPPLVLSGESSALLLTARERRGRLFGPLGRLQLFSRLLGKGPQGGWPPLSCVGKVTAASDRGRCGARTAGTGLRTRAVHLCLRRVCPGTTAELSTRGALGVRLRVPAPAAHSAHPANTKHLRLPRTRHASLSGDEPQSVALGNTIPVILPEDAVVGPVTGPHRC